MAGWSQPEIGRWRYALPVLMLVLSWLMVSKVEYPTFKAVNFRTRRSFHWVLGSILALAFTVRYWQWMPMVWFVSYLAYGLVRPWISRTWRQQLEEDDEDYPATEGSTEFPETPRPPREDNDPQSKN